MRRLGLSPAARNHAARWAERRHSEQHNRGLSFAARCMSTALFLTVLAGSMNEALALCNPQDPGCPGPIRPPPDPPPPPPPPALAFATSWVPTGVYHDL